MFRDYLQMIYKEWDVREAVGREGRTEEGGDVTF